MSDTERFAIGIILILIFVILSPILVPALIGEWIWKKIRG